MEGRVHTHGQQVKKGERRKFQKATGICLKVNAFDAAPPRSIKTLAFSR
jgi:hypothetical protein